MRPASSCETVHWPRLSVGSDSNLPSCHFRSNTCSDEYITLSIAQNRLLALCSMPPFGLPNVLTTSSFVSALRSPLVSFINQRFGGSPTRTPWSSTFKARGPVEPVGEHGLLVHHAVAVGVFQHADAIERLLRIAPGHVGQERRHLDHPQAAVGIEVHEDRRVDERLRRDELDVKARRQRERSHLLLGRQRDRLRHRWFRRRPGVPGHLGGALAP